MTVLADRDQGRRDVKLDDRSTGRTVRNFSWLALLDGQGAGSSHAAGDRTGDRFPRSEPPLEKLLPVPGRPLATAVEIERRPAVFGKGVAGQMRLGQQVESRHAARFVTAGRRGELMPVRTRQLRANRSAAPSSAHTCCRWHRSDSRLASQPAASTSHSVPSSRPPLSSLGSSSAWSDLAPGTTLHGPDSAKSATLPKAPVREIRGTPKFKTLCETTHERA